MVAGVKENSSSTPLDRLRQTLNHLEASSRPQSNHAKEKLSVVHGPTDSPLWEMTLGELLEYQCLQHRQDECLVVPWTGTRWTYGQLQMESQRLARGLIAKGVRLGDRIGVMAGNCEQYVSLFFAAASVGAILVVINNNYTLTELMYALEHTGKPSPICPQTNLFPRLTGFGNCQQAANCSSLRPKSAGVHWKVF